MQTASCRLRIAICLLGAGCLLGSCQQPQPLGDKGTEPKANFDPNAGQRIDRAKGAKDAKKYKADHKDNTYANYCNADIIRQILDTEGCKGLRIYRARNDKDRYGIVLVGVDAQGNDLLSDDKEPAVTYLLAESYEKCPLNCDGCRLLQ